MASVCGCCVASYCSCGVNQRCVVHSACAYCSGPIPENGKSPGDGGGGARPVKRKLAKFLAMEDGEVKNLNGLIGALRAEREALFLELEEERSAAAIAATETLAMITRLQEEKATVQMEASQYKRMVEERSKYDQEAIGMLNDILARQEEEKLALSREVEMYRSSIATKKSPGSSDGEYRTPLEIDREGRNLMESFDDVRSTPKVGRVSRMEVDEEGLRVHGKNEVSYERSTRGSCSSSGESSSEELFMQKYWRTSKGSAAASRDLRRAYDRLGKPDSSSGEGSSRELSSRRNEELMELNRRLQALEAERVFLKQGYGGGGGGGGASRGEDMGILEEISQQLRQIQAMELKDDGKELSEASFVFSFKGFFSFNGLRQSLNSNINRLACMFLKHTEAGGLSYGDHHHVGLSHLLENSRKSPRGVPFITRGLKCESPPQLLGSHTIHRQNVHWPMDARGRSETAFSGWDY